MTIFLEFQFRGYPRKERDFSPSFAKGNQKPLCIGQVSARVWDSGYICRNDVTTDVTYWRDPKSRGDALRVSYPIKIKMFAQ